MKENISVYFNNKNWTISVKCDYSYYNNYQQYYIIYYSKLLEDQFKTCKFYRFLFQLPRELYDNFAGCVLKDETSTLKWLGWYFPPHWTVLLWESKSDRAKILKLSWLCDLPRKKQGWGEKCHHIGFEIGNFYFKMAPEILLYHS